MRSLNDFRKLRKLVTGARLRLLRLIKGVDIDGSASISLSSRMVCGRKGAIQVGPESLIAFKTLLLTLDFETREVRSIKIGRWCFIGGGSTILPGVTIGDECIVAAGAVVFDDVPPRSIAAGNPARVIRSDITVGRFGRMKGAWENQQRLYRRDG